MAPRPTRSLRHEYELFVEQEIENYKESLPRSVLLSIGDEAVSSLATHQQLALTELLLCEEVDRIIFRRLRLPTYETWRRRRLKILEELRRPDHWGLRPDDAIVRAVRAPADARVLVAAAPDDAAALYLAANGCEVTAIAPAVEEVERVMQAAIQAGLGERVHAQIGNLASWTPQAPLSAVIVSRAALEGLSARERARVITVLQSATMDGGVHLVQTIAGSRAASTADGPSVEELRSRYRGWEVSVERTEGTARSRTFMARKGTA